MRHHHEISPREPWNYVLTHTKIIFRTTSRKLSHVISSKWHASSQPTNHKSMCYSCQHTNCSSWSKSIHAYSHTLRSKMNSPINQAINNQSMSENSMFLCQFTLKLGALAQARGVTSLKLQALD